MFYGPRFGLKPDEWVTGVCDRNETRPYIRDVDRYRGIRGLWVLSGGALPAPTDPRPGCRPWARPSPLDRPF